MPRQQKQQPAEPALMPPDRGPAGERSAVPVVVHLSGRWRGATQRLQGEALRLGAAEGAEIRVSPEPVVAAHHATLQSLADGGYELVAEPDRPVWVNGEPAQRRALASGDVLEIGRDGPLLRYRVYPPGTRPSRSLGEAFADGFDGARAGRGARATRAAGVAGALRELATGSPPWFRVVVLLAAAVFLGGTLFLAVRGRRLEQRLAREEVRIQGIAELLDQSDSRLSGDELAAVRGELAAALARVEALELRSGAGARVVAKATPSVVLLQGSYGFLDPASGESLRFLGLGADGLPLRDEAGQPVVGIGGDGPPIEVFFTGSAFVVSRDGLLLTNRHLAVPWRDDRAAQHAVEQGLEPAMRRFIAYLPREERPVEVRTHLVAQAADLALLLAPGLAGRAPPLALRDTPPAAGEEVIVMGYPAGIPALLARSDERFVAELMADERLDFWRVAAQLARSGQIAPLASRGIVAQVGRAAVVYDAETTQGGSGGPVLALDGEVVAVTSAVVTDFGGSNLAVPARTARRLLLEAALRRFLASSWR